MSREVTARTKIPVASQPFKSYIMRMRITRKSSIVPKLCWFTLGGFFARLTGNSFISKYFLLVLMVTLPFAVSAQEKKLSPGDPKCQIAAKNLLAGINRAIALSDAGKGDEALREARANFNAKSSLVMCSHTPSVQFLFIGAILQRGQYEARWGSCDRASDDLDLAGRLIKAAPLSRGDMDILIEASGAAVKIYRAMCR